MAGLHFGDQEYSDMTTFVNDIETDLVEVNVNSHDCKSV
jgi:hypothetical protein